MTVVAIRSSAKCQLISITSHIQQLVGESGIDSGMCVVFVPHTTAGIMINENADADVRFDILTHLDRLVPAVSDYRHVEGNSAAHIKALLVGSSVTVIVRTANWCWGDGRTSSCGVRRSETAVRPCQGDRITKSIACAK